MSNLSMSGITPIMMLPSTAAMPAAENLTTINKAVDLGSQRQVTADPFSWNTPDNLFAVPASGSPLCLALVLLSLAAG